MRGALLGRWNPGIIPRSPSLGSLHVNGGGGESDNKQQTEVNYRVRSEVMSAMEKSKGKKNYSRVGEIRGAEMGKGAGVM